MTDTVYYACSFVPPELIRACGFHPHRLTPTSKNIPQFQIEGMCSFTRAWLENLYEITNQNESCIVVFTTSCDQMRRAFDLFSQRKNINAFLLDIPKTINMRSLEYYKSELWRLMHFLSDISGQLFDENQLICINKKNACQNESKSINSKNIAVAGGPVPDAVLFDINKMIKTANMAIRFNLSENMLYPSFVNQNTGLSLTDLAEAYFNIPAIWKRPNDSFYEWFSCQVSDANINAVLLFRHIFCDLWHSQIHEFKKRLSIPVLDIELDGQDRLSASARSRLQAFLETLTS